MALPVVYRPKVGRDLAGGFGYCEGQTEGLGEQFLAAVDSACDAIERYPEKFARVHGEVRRALVARFPYAVFYRIESKRVAPVCRTLLCVRDGSGAATTRPQRRHCPAPLNTVLGGNVTCWCHFYGGVNEGHALFRGNQNEG